MPYVPCLNQAERDGVSTDTEQTPFLAQGLGETDDGRFGRGVVRLPDVTVKARR